jgi:hypothetical protein
MVLIWSRVKIYSRLNERGCGLMVYVCEHGIGPLGSIKGREFCDHVRTISQVLCSIELVLESCIKQVIPA